MLIRICAAQQKVEDDRDTNIMKGLSLVKRAIQLKANIVALPELHTTGFYPKNLEKVEKLDEELKLLLKLSKNVKILIVAGVAERDENLYNSAVLIYKGEIIGVYRKNILFPLNDEKKIFKAGNKLEVFETPFCKLGILICYEVRFPELFRKLMKKGAELIIIPACFPKQRIEHWSVLVRARAIENQLFVVGVNCVDEHCGGRSLIVDPMGKIVAEAGSLQEVIMGDLDLSEVERIRKEYPFLKDYESIDTETKGAD